MKKIYKILTATGMVTAFGVGVAGIAFGESLASDKKANASISDDGSVSLLTKHLFNVEQKDYKTLDQVAQKNSAGTTGINILNIGDSVAHGDYTWQILDKIREVDNEHYLKDGPPRIGSYYGFLVDALRKAGKLPKDYHINYDTSVSGLRMFELLNWFKTHKYVPLTDEADSNNVRSFDKDAVDHYHDQVNQERNDMVKKVKTADVVTMSIGGNDLIRCIKLFGKPFHDSFDTSTWGDKLKDAMKNGKFGDVISIDMGDLADILTEMEENLESTLQLIHMINPNAKVMMFETAFPFEHFPKIIRNTMAPLYSKVKEMTKRVMKINVTKNDGVHPDVHGVIHPIYDQTTIDTDREKHVAEKIVHSSDEQQDSGLNWASYTSIDYTGSKDGDPNDIYKANSLDIHPTIEGQGKIALAMIKTMEEKFGFTFPKGTTYDQSDVDKRVKFVRELHNDPNQLPNDKAYNAKVGKLNDKYYPGQPNIESPVLEDDSVHDVPVDEVDKNGNVIKTGIEIEKDNNKFYTITRTLFGAIDAFTDRVYLRDGLAIKDLDFESSTLKNYDDYQTKMKDFEHRASFIYDQYSRSLDLSKPENKKYAGTGGIPLKLWQNEATNWMISIYDKGTDPANPKDPEYQAVSKLFSFDEYKGSIAAYKEARRLMMLQSSKWDMDGDKRFTLSDIQLGTVSSLKTDKSITGIGGILDQLTSWTDFNNLWTRAFTNSFVGAKLTKPDYSDKSELGRVELTPKEIYETHLVSGSAHYDLTHGVGVELDPTSTDEVKMGQLDSTINRLKLLLHHLATNKDIGDTISDFIKDHKDDLKDWIQDAIDFIKDIDIAANKNVVYDFMENFMGDFGTFDELANWVQKLLENKDVQDALNPILKDNGISMDAKGIDSKLILARTYLSKIDGVLQGMSNEDRREKFGEPFAKLTQSLMDQMFGAGEKQPILNVLAESIWGSLGKLLDFATPLLPSSIPSFAVGMIKPTLLDPINKALDGMSEKDKQAKFFGPLIKTIQKAISQVTSSNGGSKTPIIKAFIKEFINIANNIGVDLSSINGLVDQYLK